MLAWPLASLGTGPRGVLVVAALGCVQKLGRIEREEDFSGDELSESSREPAGESPVRGDAKVPGSEAPGVGRNAGVEAGCIKWPVRNMK